jgi:hypothetical protein
MTPNVPVETTINFPASIYASIPANATNINFTFKTRLESLHFDVNFYDVETEIISSPLSYFNGGYPTGSSYPDNSTQPEDTYTYSIESSDSDPTGNWKIKATYLGDDFGGDEVAITYTIILSWNQPPQPSDCDTTVCHGHSIKLLAYDHGTSGLANHTYKWSTGAQTPSITVTQSGNYKLTVTNGSGESASDDIDVRFKSKTAALLQTICQGESVTVGQQVFTTSVSNVPVLLATSEGCDSTIAVTVTVKPKPATVNQTVQLCGNETYTIGTSTYGPSDIGAHTDVLEAANGCDSVVVTTIQAADAKTKNNPQTICPDGSYTINGHTYTQAGTYEDVLTTASGCDSIVTTIISIAEIPETHVDATICKGSSYVFNGHTYTQAGTYEDVLTGPNGCDSIIITTLSVQEIEGIDDQHVTICDGDEYVFNGHSYTLEGTYKDTLKSEMGCDSFVMITHLDVLKLALEIKVKEESICEGSSFTFNGHTYTEAGEYLDTVHYKNTDCDSVVVKLKLSITESIHKNIEAAICKGKTYEFDGDLLTEAGEYEASYTSSSGCDSIVVLTLSVDDEIHTQQEKTICYGEPFEGIAYEKDTTLVKEYIRTDDCDSIHTIYLHVLPKLVLEVIPLGANCTITGLKAVASGGSGGYSFHWSNGSENPTQQNLEPGDYTVTVTDEKGCKSIAFGSVGTSSGMQVHYDVRHLSCHGDSDGEIFLEIAGRPPYNIEWSNGSHEQHLFDLKAGNYTVVVKDANGCIFGTTIEVKEPAELKVEVATTPSTEGSNGTATAIITGGTNPYQIHWSNGKTTAHIEGLIVGVYEVVVIDKNGCEATGRGEVSSTTTSTHDIDGLLGIRLSPNPTPGRIEVLLEMTQSLEVNLSIYDLQGRRTQQQAQQGSRIVQAFDLTDQPNGTYLLVAEAKGKRTARKFVLSK